MKIATWNVNSLNVRLPHVLQWLEAEQPDVLALQETKLVDDKFPHDDFEKLGYHTMCCGQKTYNGVAIASRKPLANAVRALPDFEDPQCRVLAGTIDGVRVIDVYVPNGQTVGSEKYRYKLAWLDALRHWLQAELAEYPELAIVGDFNIAPEPGDVHDPAEWEGKVLFSEPERMAFRALLGLGLKDSFRLFEQVEGSFSWWDYRAGSFRRDRGLRIDHVLASDALAARCRNVSIDREPRGWERPSDHAPVTATFGSAED
ncbi:MAG TPA: exodeoxyribonuclease III [Gammaproteobacteria bacterium]|nr:exodeoxyribonuclease III [Gammaproteobacteria bacterium]